MRVIIKKRSFADVYVGLIYGGIGLLGWTLARTVPNLPQYMPPCLFRQWLQIPCPACGSTHAGLELANFHFLQAFIINPFMFFVYVGLFLWFLNSLGGALLEKNLSFILTKRENRMAKILFVLAIPLNWFYLSSR